MVATLAAEADALIAEFRARPREEPVLGRCARPSRW